MNVDIRDKDTETDYIAMMREAMKERYSRPRRNGWSAVS